MLSTKKKTKTATEIVEEALASEHDIRPFPDSINRLIEAMKQPDSDAQTLADIIEVDIAFSTRILRVVNSPMFGIANHVRSVRQAATILGHKALKNLALSYAGAQIISGDGKAKEERAALWEHSLGCATVARNLSALIPSIDADEAFLAAVFHDIGKLFFLEVIPAEYAELSALATGGPELLAQENALCGCTHTQAGLRLTVSWPLPDTVKAAINYHPDPTMDTEDNALSKLVQVANGLARSAGIGSTHCECEASLVQAEEYFGLQPDKVHEVMEQSVEAFNEIRQSYV